MKRLMLLITVVALALGSPAAAQGPELTETYSDAHITFRYPAGWHILLSEDDSPVLSNVPIEEASVFDVDQDALKITISALFQENVDNKAIVETLSEEEARVFVTAYLGGFLTGTVNILASMAAAFSDQEIELEATFVDIGYVAIDEKVTFAVETELAWGDAGIGLLVMVSDDFNIITTTPLGEMAQWRAVVEQIAKTVVVSG